MTVVPGFGNPYGDPDINPMTGEKYPHLTEEETPEPTPDATPQTVPSRANVEG